MPTLDNVKHEQFAQLVAAGKAQGEAYAMAYGNDSQGAAVNASKLMKKPNILARIAEFRKVITSQLPVLSLAEKRTFLRDVVKTPVGTVDEASPLTQSYKVRTRTDRDGNTVEEKEYELPNKLKALELDAKLAGEFIQPGSKFEVNIYSGEKIADAIEIESESAPATPAE